MTKFEALLDNLKSKDFSDIVHDWNIRCEIDGCNNVRIYNMDEFNEVLKGKTPVEIIRMTSHSRFNLDNVYFAFVTDRYVVSFDDINEYEKLDYTKLLDCLVEYNDDYIHEFYTTDIRGLYHAFLDCYPDIYKDSDILIDVINDYIMDNCGSLLEEDWDELANDIEKMLATL
jgi:hypothetical protein